jgi:hypothetical protein
MDRVKIVNYFIDKIEDKNFEIHQVRQELEKNNLDEEEIRIIVRLVDNELQRRLLLNTENKRSNDLIWIGLILTAIGMGITIGTYTGIINMGDHFLITYGPFLGGLSILFGGLARSRFK